MDELTERETRDVTKTFLTGKHSATLIIPIAVARRYGLEKPEHVVIEGRPDGILIKKLKVYEERENDSMQK